MLKQIKTSGIFVKLKVSQWTETFQLLTKHLHFESTLGKKACEGPNVQLHECGNSHYSNCTQFFISHLADHFKK